MTDMIAAEPALAVRILRRLGVVLRSTGVPGAAPRLEAPARETPAGRLAAVIRDALHDGAPVTVVGCGTSEHAAMAVAEILSEAAGRGVVRGAGQPNCVVARQAFEAALRPQRGGLVIAVSHEGATGATNAAVTAALARGARAAAITASASSPIARLAGTVVETREVDRSWCHTVGYASPVIAAVAVGAALTGESREAEPAAIRALLRAGMDQSETAEAIAGELAVAREIAIIASGADIPAGRELALKIAEAAWIPTVFHDVETILHGHLPAMDQQTGIVAVLADRDGREARSVRAQQAVASIGRLGARPAAIVADEVDGIWPAFLTPAGRIVVPEAPSLPAPTAALVGTLVPLQLIAERLARARGTNPDPIRRDQLAYREAAGLAE
jgi:glutamine---fructose-6-phosphate transaminase (isomerizing)